MKRKTWTMEDVIFACEMIEEGKPLNEVAIELEREEGSIRTKLNSLRKQGAKIPPFPRKKKTSLLSIDEINEALGS